MNRRNQLREPILKATSFIVIALAAAGSMVCNASAQEIVFGSRSSAPSRAASSDLVVGALSSTSRETRVPSMSAAATPAVREVTASKVAPVVASDTPTARFTVARSDKTIRETLAKWAKSVDWTNEPEHWTVGFDLPVLSAADLGTDFKAAVRALLSSTDLTNMPLQPCFYSNQVLRIVPKAELCDKSAS